MPASLAPQPAPVMFACPRKGPIFTGHRLKPAEFERLAESRAFRCAGCGEIHTWTVETAWLQGRPPATASQEG